MTDDMMKAGTALPVAQDLLPPPQMRPMPQRFDGPAGELAAFERLANSPHFRVLRRLPFIEELARGVPDHAGPLPVPREDACWLGVVDVETTGLSDVLDEMIEIAITPMQVSGDGELIAILPTQVWLNQPAEALEPDIIRITGLTDADLAGRRFDDEAISALLDSCRVLVSHNAKFDRSFLMHRYPEVARPLWGCTAADIDWPACGMEGRALQHLLFNLGYAHAPHRAGPDSWALACLLAAQDREGRAFAGHLLDAVRMPTHRVHARRAPFEVKDLLRRRGYRWRPEQKVWAIDLAPEKSEAECSWLQVNALCRHPFVEHIDAYNRHA